MKLSRLDTLANVAARAAEIVNRVYGEGFDVDFKGVDDPVTRADREANAFLVETLSRLYPGAPIVAEESDPATYGAYATADVVFFVDPLDGTREFVKRIPEFAVMIGLVESGRATLGVVHEPASGIAFAGEVGAGAVRFGTNGAREKIHVSSTHILAGARAVMSRSRPDVELAAALTNEGTTVVNVGSAGVKGARVASAAADLYVHLGGAGSRWDIAASDALVRAAGGMVTDGDGNAIDYRAPSLKNERGLVVTNGHLHEPALHLFAAFASSGSSKNGARA